MLCLCFVIIDVILCHISKFYHIVLYCIMSYIVICTIYSVNIIYIILYTKTKLYHINYVISLISLSYYISLYIYYYIILYYTILYYIILYYIILYYIIYYINILYYILYIISYHIMLYAHLYIYLSIYLHRCYCAAYDSHGVAMVLYVGTWCCCLVFTFLVIVAVVIAVVVVVMAVMTLFVDELRLYYIVAALPLRITCISCHSSWRLNSKFMQLFGRASVLCKQSKESSWICAV